MMVAENKPPGSPVFSAVPAALAAPAVPATLDAPAIPAVPAPAHVVPVHGGAAPESGLSGQVQPGPVASATAPAPSWMEDLTSVLRELMKKRKVSSLSSSPSLSSAAISPPSTSKATKPKKKKGASSPPKKAPLGPLKGLSHSGGTGVSSAGPPVPSGTGPVSPSAWRKKTGTRGVLATSNTSSPGVSGSATKPGTGSASCSREVPSVRSPARDRAAKVSTPEFAWRQD
ncbi:nascent polypeptide-associated complex subunit alpha, muscle-specific form-like [Macrobrachium nipponense]|uniref:nascent polypeptide-associated complex subunit alpha, muscle-specific form-like n=1 Tax=Macrobrachium nipponense TaxID=159736 RepID=UPI0030C8A584